MAERDSDYDEHNASGGTDASSDDEVAAVAAGVHYQDSDTDSDDDPLVSRYQNRAVQTEAMAAEQEERDKEAGSDEEDEVDDSLWGTCVTDARRCHALTGFTPGEFLELFSEVECCLEEHAGRGKRSKMTKHDKLLMVLVFAKHYETNERLSHTFAISKGHVQKLIASTTRAILGTLWHCYVEAIDIEEPQRYAELPDIVAMMDATVQEIYTPEGAFDERKRYFSGKHKIYCLKSQCLHDLRGLVFHVVAGIPGATHDVTIAQRYVNDIRRVMRPIYPHDPPLNVDESSEEEDEPARMLLVDSGYQGLQHILPCVLPYKNRPTRPLTAQQKQHNRRIAKRRVLVENYYGRMKRRHRLMTDEYRGERDNYEMYFKLCVALTNFHVGKHPLRMEN